MKAITSVAALVFTSMDALAQGTLQVVVPNNLATVEGNSSAAEPFNSTSFRFQQVFDASQFAIPAGASGRIDSISFRIDGASMERVLLFFGGSSWTLSTTTREPDGLSPVFAENRGADAVTVRNGAFGFGGNPPPPGMPGEFQNPTVTLTSEFDYIPSQGNLLLEVAGVDGQVFFPGALDGHAEAGDSISWVFATSNLAPSGPTDTFGLVTRFNITVIPEPSVWLLAAFGSGMLAMFKRKCSHGSH